MNQKNDKKSLILFIITVLIFGSTCIFSKYIYAQNVSVAMLSCVRGFLGSLFLLIVLSFRKKGTGVKIDKTKRMYLIIVGVMIALNWILLFEAYNYTSIPTATLCYYMAPTIVMVFSPLLFKERLNKTKRICIVVSLFGMVLVSGILESGLPKLSDMKGVLLGLGAAIFYAICMMMNKKLSGIDYVKKTIIELTAAAISIIPYLLLTENFNGIYLSNKAIIYLLIVGVINTGLAYFMYFKAIDKLRVQTVALVSYLDPVSSIFLAAIFLNENMNAYETVGAILIIGASIISETSANRK